MPKDLEVKTDNECLKLNGEAGRIVFTVNNGAGRPLRVRGEPRAVANTKAEWLAVVDGDRKDLGSPGFQSFTVEVKPTGAEPGPYRFLFRAYDVDDPNEHWGESLEVAFEVPKPPEPPAPKKPVWPWIVLALVLLIGGGLTAWLLLGRGVVVPNSLRGLTVADATGVLEKAGLKAKSPPTTQPSTEVEPGKVIQSDPPMGTKAKKGTEVALIVAVASPATQPTTPTTPTAGPADKFLGDWTNSAASPQNVKTVSISRDGDFLVVKVTGRRQGAAEEDWGVSRTPVSDAANGNLKPSWNSLFRRPIGFQFVTRTDTLTLSVSSDNSTLVVQGRTTFNPANGGTAASYTTTLKRKFSRFDTGILVNPDILRRGAERLTRPGGG